MSELFKYRNQQINNNGIQAENIQIGNQQANQQIGPVQEQRDRDYLKVQDQALFDIMVDSSAENMAVQLKLEREFKEEDWGNYSFKPGYFVQSYPVASKDKDTKKNEEKELKKLKKSYSHADLCTVRERSAMNKYFSERGKDLEQLANKEKAENDPYLMGYVDSILSTNIIETSFSDKNLAANIATLYEYCRKLQKYNTIKAAYPDFFKNLSDEKRIIIENKAKYANEMAAVIRRHMKAHGIVINNGVDGLKTAEVIKEDRDKKKRETDKKTADDNYKTALNSFMEKNFRTAQVDLADTLIGYTEWSSDKAVKEIKDVVMKTYGNEGPLLLVSNEEQIKLIPKISGIRDEYIRNLRDLRSKYDEANSKDAKISLIKRMEKVNRRVIYSNKCIEVVKKGILMNLMIPVNITGEEVSLARKILESGVRLEREKQLNNGEVREQKEKSESVALTYFDYKTAAKNLGTGCGATEKANMILVKAALKELEDKLGANIPKNKQVDFYSQKISIIMSIDTLKEACSQYMTTKEAAREAEGSKRYGYIKKIFQQMDRFRSYYESLSEEKFNSKRLTATNFGEIMNDDVDSLVKNEEEAGTTDELMRQADQMMITGLQGSLAVSKNDYGSADNIHNAGERIARLLKEAVPDNENSFANKKGKIIEELSLAIKACNKYCKDKNADPPSFSGGRDRLLSVRRIKGIYERQLKYFRKLEAGQINLQNRANTTFEKLITESTNKELLSEKGDVGYESDLLSEKLAVRSLYEKIEKVSADEGKGVVRTGFIRGKMPLESSNVKKGNKTISQVISFARKQGMDVSYPADVLRSFSTIRIMDFLTGRENRGDEDLVYNTEVATVAGKQMVYISSVKSVNDRKGFSNNGNLDPVALGMVDKNGRFLFPYDIEFADRIMKTNSGTLLKELVSEGARLDNNAQKAFVKRFNKIKELFKTDMKSGWRAGLKKAKKESDADIKNGYAKMENKNIPSYLKKNLIANRESPDVAEQNKSLEGEKNRWIDEQGNLITKVDIKVMEEDEKLKEAISQIDDEKSRMLAEEEIEVARQVYNNTQKIMAINEYKKSDTRSAFLMKKSKADLLKDVNKDKTDLANASNRFKEIMKDISAYCMQLSPAQYQLADNQAVGEWWSNVRVKNEITHLTTARTKIEQTVKGFDDSMQGGVKLEPMQQKEYDRLKAYLDIFNKLCDGNLGNPDPNVEVISEKENELVEVRFPEKIDKIGFVLVKHVYKNNGEIIPDKYDFEKVDSVRGNALIKGYKMRKEDDTPLFAHEPCAEDVCQGALGDCYALAAISALVEHDPGAIKSLMKDNHNGTVTVKLHHKNGDPVYVTVKKEVPVAGSNDGDYYGRHCLWVQMIEKAFVVSNLVAEYKPYWEMISDKGEMGDSQYVYESQKEKGKKSYNSIEGGQSKLFLQVLTGVAQDKIKTSTLFNTKRLKEYRETHTKKDTGAVDYRGMKGDLDAIVKEIQSAQENNKIMLANTKADLEAVDGRGHSAGEAVVRGVVGNHAYMVLGIRWIGKEPYIALRNPWGATTATVEVNRSTGATTLSKNDKEAAQFLLTPLEFNTYFEDYSTIDMKK